MILHFLACFLSIFLVPRKSMLTLAQTSLTMYRHYAFKKNQARCRYYHSPEACYSKNFGGVQITSNAPDGRLSCILNIISCYYNHIIH